MPIRSRTFSGATGDSPCCFSPCWRSIACPISSPASWPIRFTSTLGFSKADIATVTKVFGFWVGLGGIAAGGLAISRFGLMPSLLIGGVAASASHLSLAALAATGQSMPMLTLAICVKKFAGGFAGTALIAFMSSLTSPLSRRRPICAAGFTLRPAGKLLGGLPALPFHLWLCGLFVATSCIGVPVAAVVWRSARAARTPPPEALQEDAAPAGTERPTGAK